MSFEVEVLSTPVVSSTPSSTLATQPCQQTSLLLQLPYDMLCCIVDEICSSGGIPDHEALSALALTNSALLDVCRRKQFTAVAFNMRRIDTPARAKSFVELLDSNASLQQYIQSIFFGDNVFYPSMIREADIVDVEDLRDRSKYYSHFEMEDEIAHSLLYKPKDGKDFIAETLKSLKCLQFVEISFLYANLAWELASTTLREGISNLFVQSNLKSLRIQGFFGMPINLLQRFESLEELHISASTIHSQCPNTFMPDLVTTLQLPASRKERLKVVSLSHFRCNEVQPLLDLWRIRRDEPGFVDMSCPAQIDLSLGGLVNSVNLCQIIGEAAVHVKKLRIDMSEISFTIDMPPSSEKDEDYLEHFDDYDLFKKYLPALNGRLDDVNTLKDLESLELNVTYWERGPDIEELTFCPDEELRWALKLLQRVPSEYLEDVTLNIKIAGYTSGYEDSFTAFHSDQKFIWKDWAKEFSRPKYGGLQNLAVRIFGLETIDSDMPCPTLHQIIIDRALEELYPTLKKSIGCAFSVECYVARIKGLIY